MATIVVVTPAEQPPSALTTLGHDLILVPLTLGALDAPADAVVLDGRTDFAGAARLCPVLATRPVLLCVAAADLTAVQAGLGCSGLIVDGAPAAEWDARLRLLLGRRADVLQAGPITIDEGGYRASLAGRRLDLTYTEFELLKYLVDHPGRVHSREQLLAEVWGYDYFGGTRTVDVHIRRLRAKLGSEHEGLIETVRNVGYRLTPR